MLAYNARPPDPAFVGERWREMWLERMQGSPPFVHAWVGHQRRDEFWKHGSVCEDFSDMQVPIYMVGGWQDGYTDAIFRLLAGYDGQSKGLVGPWGHLYPQSGAPGPAIGFLQESLRFWDHTLKGGDGAVLEEPVLRAWMEEWADPSDPPRPERAGRWVAEPEWPPAGDPQVLHLRADGGLSQAPGEVGELAFGGSQLTGLLSGNWCGWGLPGDDAPDQRPEDGRSLCFTSEPLPERLETLGFPQARLTLSSDRPLALVAVRVCDIAPGGSSLLVSYGLLNLTHRESHEHPQPLEPGRAYAVTLPLSALGHAFPAGHRIRVALSPTYWPFAWPSPEPVTLTLTAGEGSALSLPVREPRPEDAALAPFEEPEVSQPLEVERLSGAGPANPTITHDLATGRTVLTMSTHDALQRLVEADLEVFESGVDTYSIVEGDPLSAQVRCEWRMGLARGDWRVRVETSSLMTCDAGSFLLTDSLDAYEGEERVFAKRWSERIPRDSV